MHPINLVISCSTLCILQLLDPFMKDIFILWEVPKTGRVEWRCTCSKLGRLLMIIHGQMLRHKLCVDNWATLHMVSDKPNYTNADNVRTFMITYLLTS